MKNRAVELIKISGVRQNNLQSVDIEIPRNKLVVFTGVSGSGKSSLVHDVIFQESKRKFLESFSSQARQHIGKLNRPDYDSISGISPAIAVDQKSLVKNPRSTVGTLSGLNDLLRLLFARFSLNKNAEEVSPSRSLFSFNSPHGACPQCNGLGLEDWIDPDKIIADSKKTLREGAMAITTPSGYIIYSQVTMDVLNQVCNSEGFNVDIPWNELSEKQQFIVLNGSNKIKIPFGKHTLESRMKWSGITAKPREEGYYKGIIPVMEVILKRDRNPNIMRFVSSRSCSVCKGSRLKPEAMNFKFETHNFDWFQNLSIHDLVAFFSNKPFKNQGVNHIAKSIVGLCETLINLGLDYLQLNRESTSLSGGEAQRIRIATQLAAKLRGLTYVFDEPSIGLHPEENQRLINILYQLRDNGNSVLVIEHDEQMMMAADHLIDIGPFAGKKGGELIYQGVPGGESISGFTSDYLNGVKQLKRKADFKKEAERIVIRNAAYRNLKNITASFLKGRLNVVAGKSGSGRKSLVKGIIAGYFESKQRSTNYCESIEGLSDFDRLIEIDQSPIGRTPRSNPATYTKLFDSIRDLYARLPATIERGWTKGRFSFNVKDGRCETCEGAGYQQIGLHFLGNVEVLCPECHGRRFNEETLEVKLNGKSISEVLELQIDEALAFFENEAKPLQYLETLNDLGLGYLTLGQSSTTLSGGEAQRVKLAAELSKNKGKHNLYILDEPTIGLHFYDIQILIDSISKLVEKGNTVIVIENDVNFMQLADHLVELGSGSGVHGGCIIAEGTPTQLARQEGSLIGKLLFKTGGLNFPKNIALPIRHDPICFKKVSTNNLKNIDIEIPLNELTVITGVSGSGKSSLAFDTIFNEGQYRYAENFSAYIRNIIGSSHVAVFEKATGVLPAIAINQRYSATNPRSTVGTFTEVYEYLRLLYSRIADGISTNESPVYSTMFSFNHQDGACSHCNGLGSMLVTDPLKLVTHPNKSILDGAISGSKPGKFYGDEYGQHIAILKTLAEAHRYDFSKPWNELDPELQRIAMYGTGAESYDVNWQFKRKNREGEHHFKAKWEGFVAYVKEEYDRKHADKRADALLPVMSAVNCSQCQGARLNKKALQYKIAGMNIAQMSALPVSELLHLFKEIDAGRQAINTQTQNRERSEVIAKPMVSEIIRRLEVINKLELGYVQLNRATSSLSGGEMQRMRLASMAGSGLCDVCFVLDEPTIGLHSINTNKIIAVLKDLCKNGNTVVVVEHDEEVILAADNLIDIGPEAGSNGGEVVYAGTPEGVKYCATSLTGKYLNKKIDLKPHHQHRKLQKGLSISGANANNLKHINLEIPSAGLVVFTGLSGSGKSSLLIDVVHASMKSGRAINCESFSGDEQFSQLIGLDASPIGRNPHSNLATYTGIFDSIRELFAKTESAKSHQLAKKHFSFNQKGGRCETCQGMGAIKVSMDFLADIWQVCETCKGKRYQQNVLNCKLEGKSIYDVLELTVLEAKQLFKDSRIAGDLNLLVEVGLGYLKLGQAGNTLSGGESQRLKLATVLMRRKKEHNLILLDEPTTGLHFHDIRQLMLLINKLIDAGDTVLAIEHHPGFIANADWVIELGPDGGDKGGRVTAEGRVDDLLTMPSSVTAKIL